MGDIAQLSIINYMDVIWLMDYYIGSRVSFEHAEGLVQPRHTTVANDEKEN